MRWRFTLSTSLVGALSVERYVTADSADAAQVIADNLADDYGRSAGPGVRGYADEVTPDEDIEPAHGWVDRVVDRARDAGLFERR